MMQAEQKLWFKNTGLVPIRSTLLKGYFFFLGFNELDPRIHAAEFLFHINEKKNRTDTKIFKYRVLLLFRSH